MGKAWNKTPVTLEKSIENFVHTKNNNQSKSKKKMYSKILPLVSFSEKSLRMMLACSRWLRSFLWVNACVGEWREQSQVEKELACNAVTIRALAEHMGSLELEWAFHIVTNQGKGAGWACMLLHWAVIDMSLNVEGTRTCVCLENWVS